MGRAAWRRWIVTMCAAIVIAALVGTSYRIVEDRRAAKEARDERRAARDFDDYIEQGLKLSIDPTEPDVVLRTQIEPTPTTQPPGFTPPLAGHREIVDSDGLRHIPRELRESLEFLETTDRVQVTWKQGSTGVRLLQIGSSFRFQTTSLDHPERLGNTVTVVGETAYIEDRGVRFQRPVARFTVPANDLQAAAYLSGWWAPLRQAVSSIAEFDTTAFRGGIVFTEVDTVPSSDDQERRLSQYIVKSGNQLTSFRAYGFRYEISIPSKNAELSAPSWSLNFTSPPMSWEDSIPKGHPKWVTPVISVTQVPTSTPPDDPLASQCGFTPFVPRELPSGMAPLPNGAAFRCQVNLDDVPASIGLPEHGLLQFFIVNVYESGLVRYFPDPAVAEHDPNLAASIPLDEWSNKVALRFAAAHTAPNFVIESFKPRSFSYRKGLGGSPGFERDQADLARALAERGVANFVPGFLDMMGGHWDDEGNDSDEKDTLLFMNTDDYGYAFWHIPTADLQAARFDRVDGGWNT